jgi:hypothetical protein
MLSTPRPATQQAGTRQGHFTADRVRRLGFASPALCLKHFELLYKQAMGDVADYHAQGHYEQAEDYTTYWNALIREARRTLGAMEVRG